MWLHYRIVLKLTFNIYVQMEQTNNNILTDQRKQCLSALERERQERENRIEAAAEVKAIIEKERNEIRFYHTTD